MTNDQGLGLFDDNATAAGSFPTQMRGYDKSRVDAYIQNLEAQMAELRHQVAAANANAAASSAKAKEAAESIDINQLSGHTAQILQASQAKADEIVTAASAEAQRLTDEASKAAADIRNQGQSDVDALRKSTLENLESIQTAQMADIQGVIDRTKADADASLTAARAQADGIIAQAQASADEIVSKAKHEAEQMRNQAEREATEALATAQAGRDSLVAEAHRILEEAQTTKTTVLADISAKQEAAAGKLEEETQLAVNIRSTAVAEAEQIRKESSEHAQHLIDSAHRDVAALQSKVATEAAARKNKLQADITALQQRKRAITQQLGNLFGLGAAAAQQFPEEDWADLPDITFSTIEADEAPAKPAKPKSRAKDDVPDADDQLSSDDKPRMVGDVETVVDHDDSRPENWVEETE